MKYMTGEDMTTPVFKEVDLPMFWNLFKILSVSGFHSFWEICHAASATDKAMQVGM